MELTSLVNGHTVQKQISQEMTYELAVPNLEIRDITTTHMRNHFTMER